MLYIYCIIHIYMYVLLICIEPGTIGRRNINEHLAQGPPYSDTHAGMRAGMV